MLKNNVSRSEASINIERIKNNWRERQYVQEWRKLNLGDKGVVSHGFLRTILTYNHATNSRLSVRDIQVAETIIQWLGTNMGQWFLSQVVSEAEAEKCIRRVESWNE